MAHDKKDQEIEVYISHNEFMTRVTIEIISDDQLSSEDVRDTILAHLEGFDLEDAEMDISQEH